MDEVDDAKFIISIHALRGEGDAAIRDKENPRTISIHALRGEGDLDADCKSFSGKLFQSTPSVGRATEAAQTADKFLHISIHALRGEGDAKAEAHSVEVPVFQSTPSVGRATLICRILSYLSIFQSTPSVGRATGDRANARSYIAISIHALRGEGD